MKRWHLTLGLAGTAIAAAALAPRLTALLAPTPPPALVTTPPVTEAVKTIVDKPAVEQGRLIVDAGLDRTAVLKGTASERFVTISVRAPNDEAAAERVRPPVNLAVVMDASGSMESQGKIDFAKRAAKKLVDGMEPTDAYSLVTFNNKATVVIPATPIENKALLFRKIDSVYEGGGTNLYDGMQLGTQQLDRVLDSGEIGRMVILSDGKVNEGISDPDTLARFAARASSKGVSVSAMGLGLDYNEDLLARIADLGGGTYDYINDPRELEDVFSRELEQTSSVVARNTAITLEMPPGVEAVEVIGWDAERTENGWTVFMGDVFAGAERKIVARVRVSSDTVGPLDVLTAKATYTDLVKNAPAMSSDVAMAEVTLDPNRVADSLDKSRAAAASAAWGNQYLEMSTRAYEAGDTTTAEKMLHKGSRVLEEAAASTGNAKLSEDAHNLKLQLDVYTTKTPESSSGRRAIKMNKEYFRDASR